MKRYTTFIYKARTTFIYNSWIGIGVILFKRCSLLQRAHIPIVTLLFSNHQDVLTLMLKSDYYSDHFSSAPTAKLYLHACFSVGCTSELFE